MLIFIQRYGTVENTLKDYKQDKVIKAMNSTFTDEHRRAMLRVMVKEMISAQNDP